MAANGDGVAAKAIYMAAKKEGVKTIAGQMEAKREVDEIYCICKYISNID
jgi:hypothetical protein